MSLLEKLTQGGTRAFDSVMVPDGAGTRTMTREQFVGLPLRERVKLISEGKTEFRLKGQPVPTREALKDL